MAHDPCRLDPIALDASPAPGHRRLPPFPVVAIGASAGGLQAFRKLLEHLSPDMKMAYVLIQHLDPTHESVIAGILSRTAKIPVKEVEPGMRVEPAHAYVIRPNTMITIADERLEVAPRGTGVGGKHQCINHFMNSLARTYQEKAIGVILSGTASDGSEGLETIKSEGGITFAQDDSAEFKDMPRNAIATGAVDFVLPPEEIARELARISRHPYLAPRPPPAAGPSGSESGPEGVDAILRVLRGATGVDFSLYKRTTVERRIARRMALCKADDLPGYLRHLEANSGEARILHDELLINVTSFFREPESFEVLRAMVFPSLFKDRPARDPVRIWVPGCSSGEEAYSLAVALIEFMEEKGVHAEIQVFGTDVSERAIEKARAGNYESGIKEDVSPPRLRRFFARTDGGGYQISKAIRDICVFARQDVTRDPPFSRLDILSCRNTLIYLGPVLQNRVIALFHYALKPSGFLMLGSSESVDRYGALFSVLDKKHKIYSKVPGSQAAQADYERAPGKAGSSRRSEEARTEIEFDAGRAADRLLLAQYIPASIVVTAEGQVLEVRGETGPYLRPAPGKPSPSVLKMVRDELIVDLDSAVREARQTRMRVRREGVRFRFEDRLREVQIEVVPIVGPDEAGRHFLVLFKETVPRREEPPTTPGSPPEGGDAREGEVAQLRSQLTLAREYQQSVIAKLEAANEELRTSSEETLSANEELQSTNEELETSKEELQSANEELTTLNEELQHKNLELGQLNGDLTNVMVGSNVALAIVDANLRLRRITPQVEKLLSVVSTDLGRRITDFKPSVDVPDLERMLLTVIETLTPAEREVRNPEGRWHSMRVRPYRTPENRVDGAVIVFVDIDALKRSMSEIEGARAFNDAVLDTVRDPLLVLGEDLRVRIANRAFCDTFGVAREEAENKLLYELGNRQWDIPPLRDLLGAMLLKNVSLKSIKVEHDFGAIGRKVVLLHARRIIFPSSSTPSILFAIEDITDVEHAQEVRARLAAIVESSGDAIFTNALDGTILTWNRSAERIFGYLESEIVGSKVSTLMLPDLPTEEGGINDKIRSGELIQHYVTRRRRKDGSVIHVSLTASPVLDEGGSVVGASTIAQDITDRVRAEETERFIAEAGAVVSASLDSESTLGDLARLIVPRIADWCAVHILEEDGTVRHAALVNQDPRKVKAVEEILRTHPLDPQLPHAYPKVLRTGTPDYMPEGPDPALVTSTRPDDEMALYRFLGIRSLMCVPLTVRGRTIGAITFAQAESGRRFGAGDLALAEELGRRTALAVDNAGLYRESQAAIGAREKFMSIASHELRTPLTTLQLQLQGALRAIRKAGIGSESQERLETMIKKAERQGDRIGHLVEELLDISRIASGKLALHREDVDLAAVTKEVIGHFVPLLDEKGMTVDFRVRGVAHGRWDRFRLEQVITNLFSNALKYGNGRPIRVDVEGDKDEARLVIEDHGIGIAPEVVKRIFHPFEQGGPPGQYGGLGLGLYIARQVVEAHGGSINVTTEPGRGSKFTVSLPPAFDGAGTPIASVPVSPATSTGEPLNRGGNPGASLLY